MDDRTRQALEESIAHWKRNVEAETPHDASDGWRDCACCCLFYFDEDSNVSCAGCPVSAKTGEILCGGSPYADASTELRRWRYNPEDGAGRFRIAASAEVAFLESLREVKP